jgi:hypothetical protein
MGSRGSIEKTARVTGPGGTVVIPLRLVGDRPDEKRHLDNMVQVAMRTAPEERRPDG